MSMTSEEFLDRSSSWTLACDNALLNRLKTFSENLCKQSEGILQDCDNLSTEIDLLSCKVQTVTNQFLILSNTHFTENRVEEFQEMSVGGTRNTQKVPIKTKAEKEAELISKMKEAIQIGVAVKAERDRARDNGNDEDIPSDSIKLKLPHIIGTPKFFSSRYCGLLDEMKLQPSTSRANIEQDGEAVSPSPSPSDHLSVTQPEPNKSFNDPEKVKSDSQQDLLFPTRELYRPPSISQSLYKEGSPSSADQFMQGDGTPSTASSSTSNIAQEPDRKFGSGLSSHLETKPNSLMAELNRNLHGRAPPPAVGNDSEDSEDDFRPPPPGKALKNTLFADEDDGDDDIFGEHSLFRSKQIGLENDDLFFDKPPPKASVPNLFSQNVRSPPVLFPSEPPPLDNANVQHSTPPTPDPSRNDSFERLKKKSTKVTNTTENVTRVVYGDVFSDALEVSPPPKTIPTTLSNPGNKLPEHVPETPPNNDHVKSAFIDKPTANEGKRTHGPPPSVSAENGSTSDESKVLKPGTSFVKSMALGLKIDPGALHPSAKPPSRPASIVENPPQISRTDSVSTPDPDLAQPTNLPQSIGKAEAEPEISKDEHKDDKVPIVAKHGKTNFVKSMAAGLKINPAALMPGSKPRSPSQSKPPPSEEPEFHDASQPEAESNAATVIPPPIQVISPEPTPRLAITPPAIRQKNSKSPSPTVPNILPSPQPNKIASPATVRTSSIFDDESSDEDLFKPKPERTPTQKAAANSLFRSPQETTPGNSVTIPSGSLSRNSSVTTPVQPKVAANIPIVKIPAQTQGTTTKTTIKKSIFDDSDSDDELFGSKSINSNGKGKTSLLFSDDGIFSSKPTATAREEKRSDLIRDEIKREVKPEVAAVIPVPKTTQDKEPLPVPQHTLGSHSHIPSETVPDPPDSPLFSNQADNLEDVEVDYPPTVSPLRPQEPSVTRPPSIFKSSARTPTTNLKTSTAKSIFEDSDSDDDLFKASSLKAKTGVPTSQTGNVAATITTLRKVLPDSSSSEEDMGLFTKNPKEDFNNSKGAPQHPKPTPDESLDSSTAPNSSVNHSSGTSGNVVDGFVKHAAQNLKINPLALKPGAKSMGSQPASASSFIDETESIPSGGVIVEEVAVEKGVSFDDTFTPATLLPSIAKNRAKVSQSRRPPTRKLLIAKEDESEDLDVEDMSSDSIVPPITSDDDEEGEEDLRASDPVMV